MVSASMAANDAKWSSTTAGQICEIVSAVRYVLTKPLNEESVTCHKA